MKHEQTYPCAQISAPELKKNKAFAKWLNRNLSPADGHRVATWHHAPAPIGEFSDLFMWIEGNEGSDSDMPETVWKRILKTIGPDYCGVVWIKFF